MNETKKLKIKNKQEKKNHMIAYAIKVIFFY